MTIQKTAIIQDGLKACPPLHHLLIRGDISAPYVLGGSTRLLPAEQICQFRSPAEILGLVYDRLEKIVRSSMKDYLGSLISEFKNNYHATQTASPAAVNDLGFRKYLMDTLLTNSRQARLAALLEEKTMFVTVYLPHISISSSNEHTSSGSIFLQSSHAISSRLSKIELAELLDSLAIKYRIVFLPRNVNLNNSESPIREVDYCNFATSQDLFHCCQVSSIGLEMRAYQSSRFVDQISFHDFFSVLILSRFLVTDCIYAFDFAKMIKLPCLLVGYKIDGAMYQLKSTLCSSDSVESIEVSAKKTIAKLVKVPVPDLPILNSF